MDLPRGVRERGGAHDAYAVDGWLAQLEDLGVFDPARRTIVGGQGDVLRAWSATERLYTDEILTTHTMSEEHIAWFRAGSALNVLRGD